MDHQEAFTATTGISEDVLSLRQLPRLPARATGCWLGPPQQWQPHGWWLREERACGSLPGTGCSSYLISSHPACQPPRGCGAGGTRGQSPAHLWVRSSRVCACRWQLGTQSSSPGAWKRTAGHYQPFLFFQLFMAYKGNVTWIPSQSVAMHLPEKL